MERKGLREAHRLGSAFLWLAAVALVTIAVAPAVWADDAPGGAGPATPTARLSSVDGQVQVSQGGQVLADQAVMNTPLFEGTRIATADDGRAEIQFQDGSVARVSPNSSLTITQLDAQGNAAVLLESGLGYFELQSGSVAVHFGDTVASGSGFTILRVNLDTLPGQLAIFSGNAHVVRGQALTVDLHGGESVNLSGADPSQYTLAESIEPDSWDTWNSDRDQALNADATARTGATGSFVSNDNPAWNNLDANGSWYNVPGQGQVWSPFEASNGSFDPYGNGYWMWTPRFGYIWVSGYSWGYLPFQCGMWNYYDNFGWGWMPGMGIGMGFGGLGGCGGGFGMAFYGRPNIGRSPGGYRIINRPIPRHPVGIGQGNSIIAINRRPGGSNTLLPSRDRGTPVAIGGYTVQPARAISPRPVYARGGGYQAPGNSNVRPVGNSPHTFGGNTAPARGGYTAPVARGSSGQTPSSGRGYSAPPSSGSSGGGHYSGGASGAGSAPSGGGHVSGGGGAPSGGGGGGSHGGGGGGGGSSHH